MFHILTDYEMTSDVLIGGNLLRETGLIVIVTRDSAKLVYYPRIMHMRSFVS